MALAIQHNFYQNLNKFELDTIFQEQDQEKIRSGWMLTCLAASDDKLFLGTTHGLIAIPIDKDHVAEASCIEDTETKNIQNMVFLNERIYLGTTQWLYCLEIAKDNKLRLIQTVWGDSWNLVTSLAISDNTILIGNCYGLLVGLINHSNDGKIESLEYADFAVRGNMCKFQKWIRRIVVDNGTVYCTLGGKNRDSHKLFRSTIDNKIYSGLRHFYLIRGANRGQNDQKFGVITSIIPMRDKVYVGCTRGLTLIERIGEPHKYVIGFSPFEYLYSFSPLYYLSVPQRSGQFHPKTASISGMFDDHITNSLRVVTYNSQAKKNKTFYCHELRLEPCLPTICVKTNQRPNEQTPTQQESLLLRLLPNDLLYMISRHLNKEDFNSLRKTCHKLRISLDPRVSRASFSKAINQNHLFGTDGYIYLREIMQTTMKIYERLPPSHKELFKALMLKFKNYYTPGTPRTDTPPHLPGALDIVCATGLFPMYIQCKYKGCDFTIRDSMVEERAQFCHQHVEKHLNTLPRPLELQCFSCKQYSSTVPTCCSDGCQTCLSIRLCPNAICTRCSQTRDR